MLSLLIAAALTLAGQQAAQPPASPPGALSGVVTAAGTSRPITRATLRLTTAEGREYASLQSDGAGRFTFEGVAPGTYRLHAARDGYVGAEFGQRLPERPGQTITVAASQRRDDLTIALTPTGVISGRVRDIYGEPVVNARVEALQYRYDNGRRILARAGNATTNDLGEYRLFWMQPGEYVVRITGATARAAVAGLPLVGENVLNFVRVEVDATSGNRFTTVTSATGPAGAFAPVYYPGTTDPSQAVAVTLQAGSEFPGIDMLRTEETMTTVRGRVIAPQTDDGASNPRATVRLVPRTDVLVEGETERSVRAEEDGTFEITNVLPGLYDLTASLGGTSGVFNASVQNAQLVRRVLDQELEAILQEQAQAAQGGARLDVSGFVRELPPPMYARATLDVRGGTDLIENLVLELAPGLEVTGRVSLPPGETPDLTALRVELPEDRPLFGTSASAQVAQDGTFTITGLPPADYRGVRVAGLPARFHLEAARLGAIEALDAPFTLGARSAPNIDIRLGAAPGTIDAATFGPDGERLPDMRVVLVPDPSKRGREDLYRTAWSDANALVRFENVAPGQYRLFAWDHVVDGAWQNADFIRRYENNGIPVRIAPGGSASASVTVIR